MDKWVDPRPPVWQGIVKGKLVTIYDMVAYEESKRLYPDDFVDVDKFQASSNHKPAFAKQKPQARYNWITKLEKPLGGVVR